MLLCNFINNHLSHIGDILAIIFVFPWLIYYLLQKNERTFFENYLLFMVIGGLFADIVFTCIYVVDNLCECNSSKIE